MKKAILMAIVSFGIVVVACKKNDNGKIATTAQLLTSTTWRYDTVALDLNRDGIPDSPVPSSIIQSCNLDNTITFKSDMTGISDEGPTKCADTIPQSTTFTWSLKNKDSTLSIVGNSSSNLNGDITIKSITNTRMVLIKGISINVPFPLSANVIITLKK